MKIKQLIQKQPFSGKIVIICGASKGIGFATAKYVAQFGGNLCLVARNQETLQQAQEECQKLCSNSNQFVEMFACDTTDEIKFRQLFDEFVAKRGVPDYMINVVGYAHPSYLQNLKIEDFRNNMNVNYYGQLVPMMCILPYYLKQKRGYYANVASLSSIVGIIGYATYTPTKFAIYGLIESMRHELKPYNIKFSIIFPPDTQTPGFNEENKIKPYECVEISKSGSLMSADAVALKFVKGILKENYTIYPGDSSWVQFIQRHWPKLGHFIIDTQLKLIQKKMKKKKMK
ncbi:SDR family oxidoreductase [Candidatus Harpocratesius sp.]